MAESERERELLREALAEGHRATRRRTPPFERLWARAAAEARPADGARPAGRRPRLALVAAAAATLVLTTALLLWTDHRRGRRELDRALTIAAELGEWRAPLDFLLATPGQEWLATTPRWDPRSAAPSWGLAPDPAAPNSPSPTPELPEEAPQ